MIVLSFPSLYQKLPKSEEISKINFQLETTDKINEEKIKKKFKIDFIGGNFEENRGYRKGKKYKLSDLWKKRKDEE